MQWQSLPATFPSPPADWRVPYRKLAEVVGLDPDLETGHARVATFLDPVLAAEAFEARWDHVLQHWSIQGQEA